MEILQANKTFCNLLAASGLLSEQTIRSMLARFPPRSGSALDFSNLLVEQCLLTEWQAGKLLQGKHKGFFLGPYKLLRHLAKGGMSTLYVAQHAESGDIHALKVLPPSKAGASDASYLPRFLREARLASLLNHKNVIRVYEILSNNDEQSHVHFMSMELLEGSDLYNKTSMDGPLSIRKAAEVIQQAAQGLEYAHSQGLIHRDVKPGNLFETTDGTIKLLDLGLAGIAEDADDENLTRDFNERVLGTADYLAPEQAVDSHRADSRADIYALGCTFYYILTGRPPFIDCTLPQRILAHQTKDPQDLRTLRSDIPEPLYNVLQKMLIKQRSKRLQTAGEVAEILQNWLDSTAGDSTYDQPAAMIASNEDALQARKLQRIQPSQRETSTETPTDSIRAAETQTAASPIGFANIRQTTATPQAEYSSEFERFLENLDEAHGVHDVMNPAFLKHRRKALSVVATSNDAASTPQVTDKSPAQKKTRSRRRSLFGTVLILGTLASAAAIGAAKFGFAEWCRTILQHLTDLW